MKISSLILASILTVFAGCNTDFQPDKSWKQYNLGIEIGDPYMALSAIYDILKEDENNKAAYDSLLQTYFNNGMSDPMYSIAQDYEQRFGDSLSIVKYLAYGARATGDEKNKTRYTLDAYTANPDNLELAYYVATDYFNTEDEIKLVRMEEILNEIIRNKKSEEIQVVINGTNEMASLKAASMNVLAFHNMKMQNFGMAKILLSQLIKDYPDFMLAKNNMSLLEQYIDEESSNEPKQ